MIWNSSHVSSVIIQQPEQLLHIVKNINEIDLEDTQTNYISIMEADLKVFMH